MGNCCAPRKKRPIAIGTFGLDNAGKTSVIKVLKGDSLDDVAPTIGFGSVNFDQQKFHVSLYDLGGGARIREIWKNYYAEVFGIVFVVDAADRNRLQEVRQTFASVIQHPKIQGKPILFLLNKQDISGALDEIDVSEQMNLAGLVNKYRCPCRIEPCKATKGTGKFGDSSIRSGFRWLLEQIDSRYLQMSTRVAEDVKEFQRQLEIEKHERMARIRKARELDAENEDEEDDDVAEISKANNRYRNLPFEPMPEIKEESSQYSAPSPPFLKALNGSAHSGRLSGSLSGGSQSLQKGRTQETSLGESESAVPKLPPISPQVRRQLPPPLNLSDQPIHPQQPITPSRLFSPQLTPTPPHTLPQRVTGYNSETAVPNRKPSTSDDALSDNTMFKRKRKRKRLQRIRKPNQVADESDDSNSIRLQYTSNLEKLPSTEPRPPTPPHKSEPEESNPPSANSHTHTNWAFAEDLQNTI